MARQGDGAPGAVGRAGQLGTFGGAGLFAGSVRSDAKLKEKLRQRW